jgi:hypothetical protein
MVLFANVTDFCFMLTQANKGIRHHIADRQNI